MKKTILISALIVISHYCIAQKKETIKLFKQFIAISKGYQQLPLQVKMQYKKSSNFIFSSADTATTQASFNILNASNAYIKFGNTEQLVSDSVVVMVSYDIKRMVLFEGSKKEMQRKMIPLGQINYPDSSYKALAQQYTAQTEKMSEAQTKIILTANQNVMYGNKPKDQIELLYNTHTNEPVEIITTKRLLKPITNTEELNSITQKEFIITTAEGKNYLLIEYTDDFLFTSITHNTQTLLPATIADRVIKIEDEWQTIKGFEGFTISRNTK